MSVYKRRRKSRLRLLLSASAVIVIAAFVLFSYQLWIHMDEISEYESRIIATEIINEAVDKALKDTTSAELIKEQRDEKGSLVSFYLDRTEANRINAVISQAVTEKLRQSENESFSIPVGTLSGISFLNGRGFDVTLRLHHIGSVGTDMKSEFVSGGINQTKYRVYITISVRLTALLPVGSTEITVEHQYLLGERIIVGTVPQTYFST